MRVRRTSDGGLEALASRLEGVARGDATAAMNQAVADRAGELAIEGFDAERDPRGSKWAARVPPTGSWPILNKTGETKASVKAKPTSTGAEVTIEGKSHFHQKGTSRMVARPMLPGAGGSEHWQAEIGEAAAGALRTVLEGSAS